MSPLSLGFSPCPNDTFIFNHLVQSAEKEPVPMFEKPYLEDVETLNRLAFDRRLDVTKLSFHALGHVLDHYCVLQSGSALGRGCGPLLIVGPGNASLRDLTGKKVAIPGKYTTAALLFRMFLPACLDLVEMRFEQIIDSVQNGEVGAGVIIHESRFTYDKAGLICLQDLGQWWEEVSGLPIPLGCIAAKRSLGPERIAEIDRRIKESLEWAYGHPGEANEYILQHAQETDAEVIQRHIDLYVNDFSLNLGSEGRAAIEAFIDRGQAADILPSRKAGIFCTGSLDAA